MGILQRLSLCYGALAIIHWATNYGDKAFRYVGALFTLAFIIIYLSFMVTFENSECPRDKNLIAYCNFGSYWDRKMFTKAHIFEGGDNDPEGLFTTLSSFVNGYAGYFFCLVMFDNKNQIKKILTIWTIASLMCGLIAIPLLEMMPLNKKIWSMSYTFLTIAISGISLTIITLFFDVIGK